jgi:hypothetical protein
MMNENATLYRLTRGDQPSAMVETSKDRLLATLSGMRGETVKVSWVTSQHKMRMKIVSVDEQAGTLSNHLMPNRLITEEDFCE